MFCGISRILRNTNLECTMKLFLFQIYILKLLDNQLKNVKWEDTGSHLEKLVALLTFMHIACIFKPHNKDIVL